MRVFQGPFVLLLLCAELLLPLSGEKKQKPKPAVAELRDIKVTLKGTEINIDGIVHNSGQRTIEKLVLAFQFFDTAHQPVTVLRLEVDQETIEPGDDAEIHAAANEPPRSISVEVTAADRGEKDLKVVNPGPYPID